MYNIILFCYHNIVVWVIFKVLSFYLNAIVNIYLLLREKSKVLQNNYLICIYKSIIIFIYANICTYN